MRRLKWFVVLLVIVVLSGCETTTVASIEQQQQRGGNEAIVRNQPVPDLGGWSFERHVVIEVYKARNRQIATYTYMTLEMAGQIVEICPSIGFPIPYAVQLTNPEKIESYTSGGGYAILPNAEPSSLYSPSSAEASIVNCVNEDGSMTPSYFENRVFALPYRIKADRVLERIGAESSFSIDSK